MSDAYHRAATELALMLFSAAKLLRLSRDVMSLAFDTHAEIDEDIAVDLW